MEGQVDRGEAAVREGEVREAGLCERLAEASGTAEMWEGEAKREREGRQRREAEWADERARRREVEEQVQRGEGRERVLRSELELLHTDLRQRKRSTRRAGMGAVMAAVLLLLLLGLDRWLRAVIRSQASTYTF